MQKAKSSMQFFRPGASGAGRENETVWVPNTDVYADDSGLVVQVEISGMERENLELTVDGSQLKITGHRRDRERHEKCKFIVMEIDYGPFQTTVEIPPGYDLHCARASYLNGFLRIRVPVLAGDANHVVKPAK